MTAGECPGTVDNGGVSLFYEPIVQGAERDERVPNGWIRELRQCGLHRWLSTPVGHTYGIF